MSNEVQEYNAQTGERIHYRAVCRDSRGLKLHNPIIMLSIEHDGVMSPWIDAERAQELLAEHKESLIERMDKGFVPNADLDDPFPF